MHGVETVVLLYGRSHASSWVGWSTQSSTSVCCRWPGQIGPRRCSRSPWCRTWSRQKTSKQGTVHAGVSWLFVCLLMRMMIKWLRVRWHCWHHRWWWMSLSRQCRCTVSTVCDGVSLLSQSVVNLSAVDCLTARTYECRRQDHKWCTGEIYHRRRCVKLKQAVVRDFFTPEPARETA